MSGKPKRRSRKEVLAQIAMGIAPASGAEFFPLLVHHLARALDVDCSLVGELHGTGDNTLSALTVNIHGRLAGNSEYQLEGSPFEEVSTGSPVSCPRNAREKFPRDQFLAALDFESCAAMPLQDSEGAITGLIAVLDDRPANDPDLVMEVLRFLAPRVGAEIERRRHEEALRFTQFSLDRSGDASFWTGPDARFVYVNDATCNSLGYTRQELLSMSVPDIDPIQSVEHWPRTWERVRAGISFTFESLHRRKDGSTFPVEIAVNYLEFAGKEFNCAFARDISKRKEREGLLSGQSIVLETIAKGGPLKETLATIAGLIENQSPGALCGVCLPEEDQASLTFAVGPNLHTAFTESIVNIPIGENGGPCGTAAHRKQLVVVKDVQNDPICGDYRDHILTHGFRSCWSAPVFSSSRKVIGTFAMYYPDEREPGEEELRLIETATQLAGIAIERKQDEEALRRSSERFRMLIERMPEGMLVHRFGPIMYANPKAASSLGYDRPEELIGKSIVDLVAPEIRDSAAQRVREMYETRMPAPATEMNLHRRDGGTTIAEMEAIPVEFDGEPAVIAIARDVTERKRMQARLLEADRMASVGTLAAGVAHEINNPLAYVISNLDYLVREVPGILKVLAEQGAPSRALPDGARKGGAPAGLAERLDDIEETLQEAREGAERVRQIVRDLRTFSRDGDEERRPVDAQSVMESSINMAWGEIRKRAQLVRVFSPVPPVHANESRLGQVFLNLLLNAAQALAEGNIEQNRVQVTIGPAGKKRVLIEVRDTGEGIAPENLKRIFQPFFTTKPVGIGTGLGLSICQNIITSLGGEISARSEVGRYTSFRVILPVSPENGDGDS